MRRAARLAVVVALVAALAPARAAIAPGFDARDRLRAAQAERDAAIVRAQRYAAQAALIDDATLRAEAEARALDARIVESRAAITAARMEERSAREQLAVAQDDLAREQRPQARMLAALQKLARRPLLLSLLEPASMRDQMRRQALFAALEPAIVARSADMRDRVSRLQRLERAAARAQAAETAARERLTRQRDARAELAQRNRGLARSLDAAANLASRDAALLTAEQRTISALISRKKEQEGIADALATLSLPVLNDTTQDVDHKWKMPVSGSVISGFGEKDASGLRSDGITLATEAGSRVSAPRSGDIVFAQAWPGYGQVVLIAHDDEALSVIAGLASLSVRQGDTVANGAAIGRAPKADPRIYVELRRSGEPVHPWQ